MFEARRAALRQSRKQIRASSSGGAGGGAGAGAGAGAATRSRGTVSKRGASKLATVTVHVPYKLVVTPRIRSHIAKELATHLLFARQQLPWYR